MSEHECFSRSIQTARLQISVGYFSFRSDLLKNKRVWGIMELKSYTCEKCGGVLSVEKTQKILDCPFCQNTFHTVSFHKSEIIKQAAENLNRKEFSAARSKYREILEDDPENFDGLLGSLLCTGRVPSANKISDVKSISEHETDAMLKMLKLKKDFFYSESSPYFRKLSDLLELAQKYKDRKSEIERIRRENKIGYGQISDVKKKQETVEKAVPAVFKGIGMIFMILFANRVDSTGGILGIVTLVILLLMFLIFKLGAPTGTLVFLILVFAFLCVSVILSKLVARKHRKQVEMYREDTQANHTEFLEIEEDMHAIEKQYDEEYAELKKLTPADASSAPVKKKQQIEKPAVFTEEEKQVFCAKCGAELALDRERSLYTCKFCGVASGASLFIGDVFGKAQRALSSKEFEEAEICFTNGLMMKPDDFSSRLGRILAEGRWTSFNDFTLNQETHIPPFRVKNLLARIDEAEAHASEYDKAIFRNLRELVNIVPRAEVLFKESRRTKNDAKWVEEKHRFDSIRSETQKLLSARA